MAIPGGFFGKFFGKTISDAAGFGIGGALVSPLEPLLVELRQVNWQSVVAGGGGSALDPNTAARISIAGIPTGVDLERDSHRHGTDSDRWELLRELNRNYPGFAESLELWRRGIIDQPAFTKALRRSGVPDEWIGHLANLKTDILDPGQLAASIHRGLIPVPGLLKGEQPQPPFNVEAYPVYDIDALDEAAGNGYDRKRLGVLVGLQGLPMGVIEAAQAFYRKIITRGDYIRAFNESNNRNEWADAVLEYARQIPTARDFFENALRGYHSLAWAQTQAERHGMTPEDSLVIYQNQGRPMNIRQITQALSRGGVFKPEPGEIKDPYLASIVEGSLKPAYYDLAESLKYTLPSPFVMRQLTASGVWTEAKAAQRLKDSGWLPADADEAAKAWASGTGGTSDPLVKKAQNQLWTATYSSYVARETDDATARAKLAKLGASATAQTSVLALWGEVRDLVRAQLTPAQVKKAYAAAVPNPATGQPWTRDDAFNALVARGYDDDDANTILELPVTG